MIAKLLKQMTKTSLLLAALTLLAACNTGFGRSGNNDLEDLDITGLTAAGAESSINIDPSFDEDENEYDADVTQEIVAVIINAELEDEDTATLRINGVIVESGDDYEVSLAFGENDIEILVTAENESEQTYTVTIDRSTESGSDVDTLDALSLVNVDLEPGFATTQSDYTASVNYFVNATRVAVERTDDGSVVTIASPEGYDDTVTEDNDSGWIEIPLDDTSDTTTVTVNVVAENVTDSSVYSVDITRAGQDALATQHHVKASNTDSGDSFGYSVAISGDTFVVGAPAEDSDDENNENSDTLTSAGAAYVFTESGDTWEQQAYIKAPEDLIAESDEFGASVAIDGDLLVVGAPNGNGGTGQVHIYARSGATWNYEWTLSGGASNDEFGYAVALSGDYLVIGAPGWSNDRGIVYVYERGNDNEDWDSMTVEDNSGETDSDRLGASLAISTAYEVLEIVVGVPGRLGGRAYLYEYDDESGNSWTREQALVGENTEEGDDFGASVAILFDRIAVGAPGESSDETGVLENVASDQDEDDLADAGAAYVFARESQGDDFEQQVYLKASQTYANYFGRSVALSANMLAVGAPWEASDADNINGEDEDDSEDRAGAVYIFAFTGVTETFTSQDHENWSYQVYIKSSDSETGDLFGQSLAFSGESLLVGATGEDSGTTGVDSGTNNDDSGSGAVFVVE